MKTTVKTFDCVEMQHRGGEEVRRRTAGMAEEEEVRFWREKTAEMLDIQKRDKQRAVGRPGRVAEL